MRAVDDVGGGDHRRARDRRVVAREDRLELALRIDGGEVADSKNSSPLQKAVVAVEHLDEDVEPGIDQLRAALGNEPQHFLVAVAQRALRGLEPLDQLGNPLRIRDDASDDRVDVGSLVSQLLGNVYFSHINTLPYRPCRQRHTTLLSAVHSPRLGRLSRAQRGGACIRLTQAPRKLRKNTVAISYSAGIGWPKATSSMYSTPEAF
jgi:hypothetical protein